MIKIYTYYNCGGFKDLYLGSLDDTDEYKYFVNLYPVYRKRLLDNPNDQKTAEKLKEWDALSQIIQINDNSTESYPQEASCAVTHAGYKLLFEKIGSDSLLLALRDIPGKSDGYGRSTPFLIMLLSDNITNDYLRLMNLCAYIASNLQSAENFAAGLFEYDPKVNAEKFNFKSFKDNINSIMDVMSVVTQDLIPKHKVFYLSIPQGLKVEDSCREQGFRLGDIEHWEFVNNNVPSNPISRESESIGTENKPPQKDKSNNESNVLNKLKDLFFGDPIKGDPQDYCKNISECDAKIKNCEKRLEDVNSKLNNHVQVVNQEISDIRSNVSLLRQGVLQLEKALKKQSDIVDLLKEKQEKLENKVNALQKYFYIEIGVAVLLFIVLFILLFVIK